ncbi:MAG: ABC transporter substrate-binding protein [Lachnospiraceae bacterium]|nr:ABC transporter substrate-binding protein [Lachnospiraceae bacterium]
MLKKFRIIAAGLALSVMFAACGAKEEVTTTEVIEETSKEEVSETEASKDDKVADQSDTVEAGDVTEEGMTPIGVSDIKEGTYQVEVNSSSSMFKITACTLTVADGKMTADMTMSGTGYLYLFMGTGEEAAAKSEDSYIPFVEDESGAYHFTIPVESLDSAFDCAAFSKKKEKWYDRKLCVKSSSLPVDAVSAEAKGEGDKKEASSFPDGDYTVEVSLEGGSGKASVTSPCKVTIKDGKATAFIEWSSPNYDYMLVNDVKYEQTNTEGNSTFEIPVDAFDYKMPVVADTTAMSKPHEIEYTLYFDSKGIGGDTSKNTELKYATQFSIENYSEDIKVLTVADTDKFVIARGDSNVPSDLLVGATLIRDPEKNIYVASSSSMDYFRELKKLDTVTMTSTKREDWSLTDVQDLFASGAISYIGKYSAPDYEKLVKDGTSLAIENTMIYHNPEVKEKLEELGIPVIVEHSSYEKHPLGRLEWIKFYGALLGCEKEADAFFEEQVGKITEKEKISKKVAYFYITPKGVANVRKPGDYIAKLVEMAGGDYVPDMGETEEDNALSTMNMQFEDFYKNVVDADILIYNSTIYGGIKDTSELIEKNKLFAGFKAVKEKRVYCTDLDVFQRPTGICELLKEISDIIEDEKNEGGEYIYRVK